MNTKTKYMIPAFAAVFALTFALTAPYSMADPGAEDRPWKDGAKWDEKKHHMDPKGPMGPHAILVEGFTGSVALPEEMSPDAHDSIKNQVTVSLGQAVSVAESNGMTDAMKASIGIAKDDQDNKYVVWTITSINKDAESQTMTKNIFVVDAGDSTNFTTITKTFDHSMTSERMQDKITAKAEKFQQKFSEPTGDANVDAARKQFLDLMQQLRDAYQSGDTEAAQSINDQLKELKQTVFLNMRSPHL